MNIEPTLWFLLHDALSAASPLGSAQLSSARLGTVQSNMQDGECGDSRRTRAYPAGDREHGHQLYWADPPVSKSPRRVSRGKAPWRQLIPRRHPAEGARLAVTSTKLATPGACSKL